MLMHIKYTNIKFKLYVDNVWEWWFVVHINIKNICMIVSSNTSYENNELIDSIYQTQFSAVI